MRSVKCAGLGWCLRLVMGAVILPLMVSCSEPAEIKVGFVGGLTGRTSGLGVAGRDGAMLAIEEQNVAGGIHGRSIRLVVKDDQQDAEIARTVVTELVEEQVAAIIGHMTSSMSMITQPIINPAHMVMISPTTKTDLLSGQDDYFFRVTAPLTANARQLAGYVAGTLNLTQFAVVYDVGNRAFTEAWLKAFREAFAERGGKVVLAEPYVSGPEVSFNELARKLADVEPEGLLILASAMDTALLSQQFYKLGNDIPLFTSEWSFTSDLINFGGRAVQGMTSFHSFNADSTAPRYLKFKEHFETRFGYTPSFATVLAYDAAQLLLTALEKNPDPKQLKQTLLSIGEFEGLQSKIVLDRFGDVERELFLTVIEDGRFHIK